MTPIKQIVYLPVEEGTSDMSVTYWEKDVHITDVKEVDAFVFTQEQLNEYTSKVIKQALENAAESKCTYVKVDLEGRKTHPTGLCKQSITNTFEETFKKFEV